MAFENEVDNLNERAAEFRDLLASLTSDRQLVSDRVASQAVLMAQAEYWAIQAEANGGTAPTDPTTPADPSVNDIMTNGVIDEAKWRTMADQMYTTAGMNYRFGTPSAAIPGLPTYPEPVSRRMPVGDVRNYQYGEYTPGYDDFSSNQGHVAYVADDPANNIGIRDYLASGFSNATASVKPEPNWTRYGDIARETTYWKNNGYPNLGKPTCMGHAMGRPGWATQSIIGFQNGFMCTIGANTMTNTSKCQLPDGLVPVSIAVTSSNEFATVVCWDKNTFQSVLAIVSLTGLGSDMTIANPTPDPAGTEGGWWGEWEEPHPGMHNLGNLAYMKCIGVIPLGLKAATEVSATTGHHRFGYLNGSQVNGTTGNTGNWTASEAQRQRWATGEYSDRVARQGLAVVISKSEKKVVFVDLTPIFAYINKMYFSSREQYLLTTNIGDGTDQWPFTFTKAPEQMPTIIKTFNVESEPTSCCMFTFVYDNAHRQAFVGLKNGQMITYNLGGFAQPLEGSSPPRTTVGVPANLVEAGRTFVGTNPTSITFVREKGGEDAGLVNDVTRTLIVCSREEKALRWLEMGATTGTERRKCQMTQISDPIWAEDTDNHGTESYVVQVADFTGRCTHNVLWGPIILHTINNLRYNLLENQPFNHAGTYPVDGYPFRVMSANVS